MVKSSSRQGSASGAAAEGADAAREAQAAPMTGPAPESFEHALGELEQIVQRMESGALSLEQSLADYRRGAALVGWCRRSLADVQQQVRILEADLLRPFEVDAADDSR
ncbi:MAG: exodeoxyribonuclease VII small subunit [Burkholderiales bacterium]|nr:MAG: exodeoxyribonuclease VII small subunit [Burkholderiales bacterium]